MLEAFWSLSFHDILEISAHQVSPLVMVTARQVVNSLRRILKSQFNIGLAISILLQISWQAVIIFTERLFSSEVDSFARVSELIYKL